MNDELLDALREVLDPEVGVNIVDLGLVYGIERGESEVRVRMTATSAACPLAQQMAEEAEAAIKKRVPTSKVTVELVWQPAWDPSRMSPSAKKALGWA